MPELLTDNQRDILHRYANGAAVSDIAKAQGCKASDVSTVLNAPAVAGAAGVSTVEQLLAAGESHPQPRVRSVALRARTLVETLRSLIEEEQRSAAARARIAELEAQLAAARAELGAGAPRVHATGNGEAKAIRAWARAAGVDCPTFGVIPAKVQAAYREAHKTS